MAYSEVTASAVTDLPALIAAFANAEGWTVAGTTVTRAGGGRSFEITASIGGTNNREHRLFVTDTATPTQRVWTQLPWINGVVNNPTVLVPTKAHLFGNEDFIACVIECGYNHYRHVYIGNMAKIGNYTGGEVICANCGSFFFPGSGSNQTFRSSGHKYLFAASHNASDGNGPVGLNSGGVNIVHADNDTPYRQFDGPAGTNSRLNLTDNMVFGGAGDGINDGYVTRGLSDYAGSNILVPVQLFAPDSDNVGADLRNRPIGYPIGVRMVDMRGIEPGQAILVGSDSWRVFPEFSKRPVVSVPYGASKTTGDGFYPSYETSYMLGLAYPED